MAGRVSANAFLGAHWTGNAAFRQASRSMSMLARQSAMTTRSISMFERGTVRAMRGVMRFFSRQVGNVFRSFFFGLRIYAITAGAAISAFAVNAVKSFRDFDKKLRETTALIAGGQVAGGKGSLSSRLKKARVDAQREYKAYQRDLMAMSVPLRQTPQTMAGGLKEIVSAGYVGRGPAARSASTTILSAAAQGATAGGAEVATSTRMLIQIMNALGLKGKPVGKAGAGAPLTGANSPSGIIDRVFQAMNYGVNVTYPDIAAGLSNVIGPIGAVMNPANQRTGRADPKRGGKVLDQIMSGIIIGSQKGLTVSKSTIGMANMIEKILNPTSQAEDEYKRIGLTPGAGLLQGGLIGSGSAFDQISKALIKTDGTGAKATETLNTLFKDIRGFRLATTLFNTGLNNTNSILKLVSDSSGAARAAFDEQGQSLEGMIDGFKSLFEVAKIGVGGALTPTVTRMLSAGTDIINQVTGGQRGAAADAAFYRQLGTKGGQSTPGRYGATLAPEDRKAFYQYRAFQQMDIGAITGKAAAAVGESLGSWWNAGGKQTFSDMVTGMISMAFKALGKALDSTPEVYTFAVKMGVQMGKAMLGELYRALGGGGGGGITGMLGGGSGKLFRGGGDTSATGLAESGLAALVGITAFRGLGPRLAGKGLTGRLGMGALAGGATALGGGSAEAAMLMAMLGSVFPMNPARGQSYLGRRIGGRFKGYFRRPSVGGTKGATGALGAMADAAVGSMIVHATSVVVNGAMGGLGAGGAPMYGVGPSSPYPRQPDKPVTPMFTGPSSAYPRMTKAQQLRYFVGENAGRGARAAGVGAAALGGLSMGMGGGTASLLGSAFGTAAGAALMLTPLAPIAPIAMMGLGMVGGMAGGYVDDRNKRIASEEEKQRAAAFLTDLQSKNFSGSQIAYGLSAVKSPLTTSRQRILRGPKAGQLSAEKAPMAAALGGVVQQSGVATVDAVNRLAPALQQLANAKGLKGVGKASEKIQMILLAMGSPADTASIIQSLVDAKTGEVVQAEAERLLRGQELKKIKRIKKYNKSYMEGRDPQSQAAMRDNLAKAQGIVSPEAMKYFKTGGNQAGTEMTYGLTETVGPSIKTYDSALGMGFVKLATGDGPMMKGVRQAGTAAGAGFMQAFKAAGPGAIMDTIVATNLTEDSPDPNAKFLPNGKPRRGAARGAGAGAGAGVTVNFNGSVSFANDQDVEKVAARLAKSLKSAMNNRPKMVDKTKKQ